MLKDTKDYSNSYDLASSTLKKSVDNDENKIKISEFAEKYTDNLLTYNKNYIMWQIRLFDLKNQCKEINKKYQDFSEGKTVFPGNHLFDSNWL